MREFLRRHRFVITVLLAGLLALGGYGAADRATSARSDTAAASPPDTLVLSVSGYMKQIETASWSPVASSAGYALYKDGVLVATAGPTATSTRFGFGSGGQHTLAVWAQYAPPPVTTTAATTTDPVTTTSPTTTTAPDTTTATTPTTAPATTTTPTTTVTPPSSTANLWVSTTGLSTCVRAAQPVDYNAAVQAGNVCSTGPIAYAKAQLGDTVLLQGGTYTTGWTFPASSSKVGATGTCRYGYSTASDFSNCVTFAPAPGQNVSFQVPGSFANAIFICASFISIKDVTINQTTYTDAFGAPVSNRSVLIGKGDDSCGTTAPHDIYLSNIRYGGQAAIVGGAYNVWVVGGTAVSASNEPWQFGGQGNNGLTPGVHDSGIVNVTFPGGSFAATDYTHHHMECIHMDSSGDHNVIAGDSFTNCPVYAIRVEAEGPTANGGNRQTNHLIENNYFDGGTRSTSGTLNFDCHDNGCVVTGNTVRSNTFVGAGGFTWENDCSFVASNTCTMTNNSWQIAG